MALRKAIPCRFPLRGRLGSRKPTHSPPMSFSRGAPQEYERREKTGAFEPPARKAAGPDHEAVLQARIKDLERQAGNETNRRGVGGFGCGRPPFFFFVLSLFWWFRGGWGILGHFGAFWGILGAVLGHFWGQFWGIWGSWVSSSFFSFSFLVVSGRLGHFGACWGIFGHFGAFWGHFVAFLGHLGQLG